MIIAMMATHEVITWTTLEPKPQADSAMPIASFPLAGMSATASRSSVSFSSSSSSSNFRVFLAELPPRGVPLNDADIDFSCGVTAHDASVSHTSTCYDDDAVPCTPALSDRGVRRRYFLRRAQWAYPGGKGVSRCNGSPSLTGQCTRAA